MKLLLQLEWLKVKKYRTFWAFLILFVIALTGINYILYSFQIDIHTSTQGQINVQFFNFPQVWSTTAWLSGFSVILLGLLMIVLITNEFTFKTNRQQIIDGLSRSQFIMGKWLMAIVLLVFAWLVYFIMALSMGSANSPDNIALFDGFKYAGYFLLKIAIYLSIAFMFAVWFKRSGLAIALYIVYVLLIEGIAGYILNRYVNGLGTFLPLAAGSHLVSNPFKGFVTVGGQQTISNSWYVLTCIAWIILLVYLSFRYIRRADL